MTALNDADRSAAPKWGRSAAVPARMPSNSVERTSYYPDWLPSRRFLSAVIAIGGMQLLATMDSTVAIVALPVVGPVGWFAVGRPPGGGIAGPGRRPPIAPDDDPDFLRRL